MRDRIVSTYIEAIVRGVTKDKTKPHNTMRRLRRMAKVMHQKSKYRLRMINRVVT